MNSPVQVGLVGIGGFGQRHLNTLTTLSPGGTCRFVAVADPFSSRHEDVVAALQACGVEVLDDFSSLVSRDEVEACVIATPIALHAPQALAAFEAGKHVYLEKPPCVTLDEWTQLSSAQQANGVQCAVGFQMQAHPALRFLKEQLCAGAIGKLQTVWASVRWLRGDSYYARSPWAAQWTHQGQPVYDGPATNALSHVVHATLFLSGAQVEEWGRINRVRGCLRKARPIQSYDAIFLEAETEHEVSVRLAFSHATADHEEVVMRCKGENGEAHIAWNGTVSITPHGKDMQQYQFVCDSHYAAMLNFLRATRDASHRPYSTLADCLPYLQAVNGALQSSGGAAAFDAEKIHRVEDAAGGGYYTVEGMDEAFAAFAEDAGQIPAQLSPGDWIATDAIKTQLALEPEPVSA